MTDREAIRKRLFACIDECGETLKEVAAKTKCNYSYLSGLRTKDNFDISAQLIGSFCRHYGYSPTWIILGNGQKKEQKPDRKLDKLERMMQQLLDRDEMLEKLLDGLLTPKILQKNDDLNKLIAEARKRRN